MSYNEMIPKDEQLPSEREIEAREQEAIIGELLEQVSQLYRAVGRLAPVEAFPKDTPDLLRQLCLAQQTLLEERLHSLRPELHPQVTTAGTEYSHRNEIVATLQGVIDIVQKRNVRTIDVKAEGGS